LRQVATEPDIWQQADQPPAPRPALKPPVPRLHPPRSHRARRPARKAAGLLAVLLVGGAAFAMLSVPEKRRAMLEHVESAAERAGLGLYQIALSGHRFTPASAVFEAADPGRARTLLSFDADAAKARIEGLPWVERASIERIVPDRVEIRITERVPFAVWDDGKRHVLIDRTGRVLQPVAADAMPALPRIAGAGAAREAAALLAELARHPALASRITLAQRVGSRRWTLWHAGGSAIHLPAAGEAAALATLARLLAAGLPLTGDIDLRVPARILVREQRGHRSARQHALPPPAAADARG
jgi:cell division protein FtsQ